MGAVDARPRGFLNSAGGGPSPGRRRPRLLRIRGRVWAAAGLAVSLSVFPAVNAGAHGPGIEPDAAHRRAGVGLGELAGRSLVRVYDPVANRWTQRANMNFSRWYPT